MTNPTTLNVEGIARGLEPTERDRLIFGRLDWRMSDWQDHCGDVGCPMCEGAVIPDPAPHCLSPADQALRAALLKEKDQ